MAKLVNLIPGREIKEPVVKEELGKLDVSLPQQVERFLDRAIKVIKGYNLPKNKEIMVIAKVVDALGVDKSQISSMISRIKNAGFMNEDTKFGKIDMNALMKNIEKSIDAQYGKETDKIIDKLSAKLKKAGIEDSVIDKVIEVLKKSI